MTAPVASVLAFVVALLLTRGALPWLATRAGGLRLLDRAGGRKWHHGAVPLVGGSGLLLGVLGASAVTRLVGVGVGNGVGEGSEALGAGDLVLVAVLVSLYLIGLVDDASGKSMRALTKAIATAVVLALALAWLAPGGDWRGLPIAFLVVHAFNTSDNMNGLSGGLGWAGVLGLWLASSLGLLEASLVVPSAAWSGALLAFLSLNYPRGRVFLGDSGSLLLGGWFALAWMTQAHPALLCFVVVPLADLLTVAWLRMRSRQRPWIADRRHLSHRLAHDHGWGEARTVLALVAVQFACNGLGLLLLAQVSRQRPVAWVVASVALALGCAAALAVRELPWSGRSADRPAG